MTLWVEWVASVERVQCIVGRVGTVHCGYSRYMVAEGSEKLGIVPFHLAHRDDDVNNLAVVHLLFARQSVAAEQLQTRQHVATRDLQQQQQHWHYWLRHGGFIDTQLLQWLVTRHGGPLDT